VQGISDIITIPGIINRDFADVKTIMAGMGYAVMGTATAKGEGRATLAAQAAIASPLLEAGAIDGARGILINVTGSSSLRLAEVNEASTIIQNAAHEDANIIFGAVLDEKMKDEVKITVIATGFKEVRRGRDHFESAALHNVSGSLASSGTASPEPGRRGVAGVEARAAAASVNATYEVPMIRETTVAPQPAKVQPPPMSREPEAPRMQFTPDNLDDIDSEIVRHAEPLEVTMQRQNAAPEPIETVSSSVEIRYDADDLEIPAFLRKRGEG
jgi:cell division protein FtsZ